MWDELSDERTDLSFTIAAWSGQHSHSCVRVPQDSWPYFTVTHSAPPTWRLRFPHLYSSWQGGPVMTPGTGFPFRRFLRLAGLRWRYLHPPQHGQVANSKRNSLWLASRQSYVTTNGHLASLSWCQAPSGARNRVSFSYCQRVAGFFMWGAHSDEICPFTSKSKLRGLSKKYPTIFFPRYVMVKGWGNWAQW
jgi:hypothetical protein